MTVTTVLLFLLLVSALWTVMARSLLRSALGLALTSIVLTIIMFRLNSPLAAVFELSVCAGLISVLFVSTISLTQPLSQEDVLRHMQERMARFWFLPLLIVAVGIALVLMKTVPSVHLPAPEEVKDVRVVMWQLRPVDIVGQIIILLTGAFGVVIFFKERKKK